jgi:hypothetical protein
LTTTAVSPIITSQLHTHTHREEYVDTKLTEKMVSRLKTPPAIAHRKSPGSTAEEIDGK